MAQSKSSLVSETEALDQEEFTIDKIIKAQKKWLRKNLSPEPASPDTLISGAGNLGVEGIDVPIVGTLAGKRGSFYQTHHIRVDNIKKHLTIHDLT